MISHLKKKYLSLIIRPVLLFSFSLSAVSFGFSRDSLSVTAADIEWKTEEITEGVLWKQYQGDALYSLHLSINMIAVDMNAADITYKIAYLQNGQLKTSGFAEKYDALAAVNGSFFNMNSGGSVVFMKVDGEVAAEGSLSRNPYTENGGIAWNQTCTPVIIPKPEYGWRSAEYSNILSSGPLLIHNGEKRVFHEDAFHQNRHPRTAVAVTSDGLLLWVTIDGRALQSWGMSIPELAQFFSELNAVDALNLDGGGSTTMWIKNLAGRGVVNYPSDNAVFDHEGERNVSNALMLINNN